MGYLGINDESNSSRIAANIWEGLLIRAFLLRSGRYVDLGLLANPRAQVGSWFRGRSFHNQLPNDRYQCFVQEDRSSFVKEKTFGSARCSSLTAARVFIFQEEHFFRRSRAIGRL